MKSARLAIALAAPFFACMQSLRFVDGNAEAKALSSPRSGEAIVSSNEGATAVAFRADAALPASVGHFTVVDGDGHSLRLDDFAQPFAPRLASGVWRAAVFPAVISTPTLRLVSKTPAVDFAVQTKLDALTFTASFSADGASVSGTINDPFTRFNGGTLPRSFSVSLVDADNGDAVATTDSKDAFTFAVPTLNGSGNYRVRVASTWQTLETAISVGPLLDTITIDDPAAFDQSEVETLLVFDVELPDADRCQALSALIDGTRARVAQAISPTAVDLGFVREDPQRCLRMDTAIATLQSKLAALRADEHTVMLGILVSNDTTGVSAGLLSALEAFRPQAVSSGGHLDFIGFGAVDLSVTGLFVASGTFTYSTDPALPIAFETLLQKAVPYRRYRPPTAAEVRVEPASALAPYAALKPCGVTPGVSVTPAFVSVLTPPFPDLSVAFTQASGFLPAQAFDAAVGHAHFEGCRRFCDRPADAPWLSAEACTQ